MPKQVVELSLSADKPWEQALKQVIPDSSDRLVFLTKTQQVIKFAKSFPLKFSIKYEQPEEAKVLGDVLSMNTIFELDFVDLFVITHGSNGFVFTEMEIKFVP